MVSSATSNVLVNLPWHFPLMSGIDTVDGQCRFPRLEMLNTGGQSFKMVGRKFKGGSQGKILF